jgi:cellulose synthase/poly-beta-1,6-N-acetylglucosamine synthase-like glycosyltransferase
MPLCSVVVPTLGRPEHLDACLARLRGMNYLRMEILVIHNGPKDERPREVAERWQATYLWEPRRGLSRARNRGARAAGGDIVAYLDDDTIAEPGWLTGLVREFEDERVMAVTGRILPTKVETDAERVFAALGGFSVGEEGHRVLDRDEPRWFELACFGGIGNGGNMAFRRSAFDLWPGFDERLGASALITGGEEHYAFFSLVDRGFRVVHTPEAIVRHPYPATMDELRSRAARQLAAGTAYTLFLFAEQPRYRRRLARHILSSTFKRRRASSGKPRPRVLGVWSRYRATVSGVDFFLKSRRAPRLEDHG